MVTTVEECCEVMHDAYERAAVGAGWETHRASRQPWADVPEANKNTMRVAVAALLEYLGSSMVTTPPSPSAGYPPPTPADGGTPSPRPVPPSPPPPSAHRWRVAGGHVTITGRPDLVATMLARLSARGVTVPGMTDTEPPPTPRPDPLDLVPSHVPTPTPTRPTVVPLGHSPSWWVDDDDADPDPS